MHLERYLYHGMNSVTNWQYWIVGILFGVSLLWMICRIRKGTSGEDPGCAKCDKK